MRACLTGDECEKGEVRFMGSDSFMILFDVIIFGYGIYLIYSGYQMKKTHQPSSLIINQTELVGARDVKGFCEAMYKPLILFGVLAVIYGIAGYVNDKYLNEPMANLIAIALFLILCFWFFRETKKNKTKYLK